MDEEVLLLGQKLYRMDIYAHLPSYADHAQTNVLRGEVQAETPHPPVPVTYAYTT